MNALAARLTTAGGVPDPGMGSAPPELAERINTILSLLAWLAVAAAVAGVLITAISMVLAYRRGDLSDQVGRFGLVLAACVLIGGASGLVAWAIG